MHEPLEARLGSVCRSVLGGPGKDRLPGSGLVAFFRRGCCVAGYWYLYNTQSPTKKEVLEGCCCLCWRFRPQCRFQRQHSGDDLSQRAGGGIYPPRERPSRTEVAQGPQQFLPAPRADAAAVTSHPQPGPGEGRGKPPSDPGHLL